MFNVFLIIIGDGYVKSKFFHKNNWVKAGDSGFTEKADEEDPLEPLNKKNEKAEKSTKALVKILRADKEILLTEYYQSIGKNYCPIIEEDKKQSKSFEHLSRLIKSELDSTLQEYNAQIETIENSRELRNFDEKVQKKSMKYDKAQLVLKALEHKFAELKKDVQ
jgi:hypothetical protein